MVLPETTRSGRYLRRAPNPSYYERVKTPTFAEQLGQPEHSSPLLEKAKSLGLPSVEHLESLAVQRCCWHYRNPHVIAVPPISEPEFSNEELAVALLSPNWPYSPHTIRIGGAMLGATGNDVSRLARLGIAERAGVPMRYIAQAARRFEPDNVFWKQLLEALPIMGDPPGGVMPHPT